MCIFNVKQILENEILRMRVSRVTRLKFSEGHERSR